MQQPYNTLSYNGQVTALSLISTASKQYDALT